MINEPLIKNTIVDGVEYSCIALGKDDFAIPRHMMQGEKQNGYIYKDGTLTTWSWNAFTTIDGIRYFYFEKCNLKSFASLAYENRSNALFLIRELATALTMLPKQFVDPQLGLLPVYRFYVLDNDGWLILPPDLSDLFSLYYTDEERFLSLGCFAKGGTEPSFTLIRQFAQFLYYALTSDAPYQEREIREYNYTEFPLTEYKKYLFPTLDDKTIGFIDFCLHAPSKDMRKINGNKKAEENLDWFIEKTKDLTWNVENKTKDDYQKIKDELKNKGVVQKFIAKTSQGAKRNTFWRKKGSVIIAIVATVIIVGAFLFSYISNLLEPPYTKDMEPIEIVYAFYEAQNELDVSKLTAAVKGCKAPQENEVLNLFVNKQTRMAYEQISPIVRADTWVEEGMPSFNTTMFVYGNNDVTVSKIGENKYRANLKYYSPYNYDAEENDSSNVTLSEAFTYVYDCTQEFELKYNKRGWWNIVNITDPEMNLIEVIKTPYLDK